MFLHSHPEIQFLQGRIRIVLDGVFHAGGALYSAQRDIGHHNIARNLHRQLGHLGTNIAHNLRHIQERARARATANARQDHDFNTIHRAAGRTGGNGNNIGQCASQCIGHLIVIAAQRQPGSLTDGAHAKAGSLMAKVTVDPGTFIRQQQRILIGQNLIHTGNGNINILVDFQAVRPLVQAVESQICRFRRRRLGLTICIHRQHIPLGKSALHCLQCIAARAA